MATPNPDRLKLVKEYSRTTPTFAVAKGADSSIAYLGSADFQVSELDLAAAEPAAKDLYAHGSYVTGLALAGRWLVSGGYDGKLIWWDTVERAVERTIDAHAKWIRKVAASPDGGRVASVGDDMVCRVWDAATGAKALELRGHAETTPHHYSSMLHALAYSPDGKYLATGDKVGHVVVWDAESGRQLAAVESPLMYTWEPVARLHSIGGVRSLAFSPDGKRLAVGGIGKVGNIDHLGGKARVEVFDWRAGTSVGQVQSDRFNGLVNKLAYAPDGSWLLAAGGAGEGFLLFLDSEKKKALREEKLPAHVHDFALSPKADSIVAVGHSKVTVHDLG